MYMQNNTKGETMVFLDKVLSFIERKVSRLNTWIWLKRVSILRKQQKK